MKVSVCIATYNKPRHLARTLASIQRQRLACNLEIVVVDDGSPDNETRWVCEHHARGLTYYRIDRPAGYRNPAAARNVAYRFARGEVVISQSDDVEHQPGAIEALVSELCEGTFVLARVFNRDWQGRPHLLYGRYHELVGPGWQRPLFFLGAIFRRDLYAIGGCDERFTAPGREDVWFGDCLTRGLGLRPVYSTRAVGFHLDHPRPVDLGVLSQSSNRLYRELHRAASAGEAPWAAPWAPWSLDEPWAFDEQARREHPEWPMPVLGYQSAGLPALGESAAGFCLSSRIAARIST